MRKGHDSHVVRLRDMLEAAKKIRQFLAGHNRKSFDDNEMLHLALQHLLQIVGEAAYKVTAERKAKSSTNSLAEDHRNATSHSSRIF